MASDCIPPTRDLIGVSGLGAEDQVVEMACIAVLPDRLGQEHLGLDLQEPLRQHEPRNLEGSARHRVSEMHVPIGGDRRVMGINVCGIDVQLDNIVESGADRFQSSSQVFKDLARLGFDIPLSDCVPVLIHGDLTANPRLFAGFEHLSIARARIPEPFRLNNLMHLSPLSRSSSGIALRKAVSSASTLAHHLHRVALLDSF